MSSPPISSDDQSWGIVPFAALDAGLVLVIRHRAGHWGFPKGHPEAGESPLQTAIRELREETGLKPARIAAGKCFSERYRTLRKDRPRFKSVGYYPAIIVAPELVLDPNEVIDAAWLPGSAALARLTFDGSRRILATILRHLPEILNEMTAWPPAAGPLKEFADG